MAYDYRISTQSTTGLSGTVSVSASVSVTGVGTSFLTELKVGWLLVVNGQIRRVATITNNTAATVTAAFGGAFSGAGAVYQYKNLETELGLPAPKSMFRPYSQALKLGNGRVRGGGWRTAEWQWGFVRQAARDVLRNTYCTGASSLVIIRTRQVDNSDAYADYYAIMIWPEEEKRDAGRRIEFSIKFQALNPVTLS